jgi:hypothetical protein
MVQRTAICALGAQDRGSLLIGSVCRVWGTVTPLACYTSPDDGLSVRLRDTAW